MKNGYVDRELLFNTMDKTKRNNIFNAKRNPISICSWIIFGFIEYLFGLFYILLGLYYLTFPILRIKYISTTKSWIIQGYFIYIPFFIILIWIIMICSNNIKLSSLNIFLFSIILYLFSILSPIIIRIYIVYKIVDICKLYLNYNHIYNICKFIKSSKSNKDKLLRLISIHDHLLNDHWFWMLDLRSMVT